MFVRSILPIGLLFSASLILSNTAYLYLSVAYIQMLKVSPNHPLVFAVLLISIGRVGFYPRCHPLHLLVLPHSGA